MGRARASKACLTCRARKVRCNVVEQSPCSNCHLDGIECVVSHRRRRRRSNKYRENPVLQETPNSRTQHRLRRKPFADGAQRDPHSIPRQSHRIGLEHGHDRRLRLSLSTPLQAINDRNNEDGLDKQFRPHNLPKFLAKAYSNLSPAHAAFLTLQNCFKLPDTAVQHALVQAFVEYAYPYFPVFHLHDLLCAMNQPENPIYGVSLLVYQAILFTGCAFVSSLSLDWEGSGFRSRTDARKQLFSRVALLYDLGYERDNLALLQTALLMSSSSDTPDDHRDSWYWMGNAISLAFSIGLNRCAWTQFLPPREAKLRRRIWWTCYMRDRFLALGLRRPMRIKNADVTALSLEADDFEAHVLSHDNVVVSSSGSILRDMEKQVQLVEVCVQRARLCVIMSSILDIQDMHDKSSDFVVKEGADQALMLQNAFMQAESTLCLWKSSLPASCEMGRIGSKDLEGGNAVLAVHRSHLHLTFHTMIYSLHRPRILPFSPRSPRSADRDSNEHSKQLVLDSAFSIARLAQTLGERGLDQYLPATGVTIIFPAVVVSMLDMKSKDERVKREAAKRFTLCMKAMKTMRQTYSAADVAINYIQNILEQASIQLDASNAKSPKLQSKEISPCLPPLSPLIPPIPAFDLDGENQIEDLDAMSLCLAEVAPAEESTSNTGDFGTPKDTTSLSTEADEWQEWGLDFTEEVDVSLVSEDLNTWFKEEGQDTEVMSKTISEMLDETQMDELQLLE